MKKFVCLLVIVCVFGFLTLIPAEAKECCPGFVLYDNFNSGSIDLNLWNIDSSSAVVTVENDRLKIVNDGTPDDTNGLFFKKNPERIKEVSVMVKLESPSGDIQARIFGRIGEDGDGVPIVRRVSLRYDEDRGGRTDSWTGTDTDDVHYTGFRYPIDLGIFYRIGINFNRRILTSWVKGIGKNYYIPQQPILPSSLPLTKYIGTRAFGSGGEAVVWFDDVCIRHR